MRFKRIHIVQRKLGLVDSLHTHQHIQQPPLGIVIPRGPHKLGLTPLRKDFLLPADHAIPHKEDLPQFWNVAHVNVAANPPPTATRYARAPPPNPTM